MLVEHVHELESAAINRGVELKFYGPNLVEMFGLDDASPSRPRVVPAFAFW